MPAKLSPQLAGRILEVEFNHRVAIHKIMGELDWANPDQWPIVVNLLQSIQHSVTISVGILRDML